MESIPKGSNAFFYLSPADGHSGQGPAWYAIRRGLIDRRIDAFSNQPHFRRLFQRIKNAGHRVATLEQLAERIFSGVTPLSKGDAYVEPPDGVRFIRSGEITVDGNVTPTSQVHISRTIHDGTMKRSRLERGDLLIAIVGATIGAVGIYDRDEPANINQAIAAVRLHAEDKLSEFACWYLHSTLGQRLLDYFKRPVARANINLEEIGEIPLLIPDQDERAELVTAMDAARAKRQAKLAEADALYAGLDGLILASLDLTPLPKNERKVFAILHSTTIRTRLDAFFYQPQLIKADALAHAYHGGVISLESQLAIPPVNGIDAREYISSGLAYLRVQNVKPFVIDTNEVVRIAVSHRTKMNLEIGDVLLTRKGTFGVAAKVEAGQTDCVISSEIILLRLADNSKCSADFLVAWLNSSVVQAYLNRWKSGAIMGHITQDVVSNLPIPLAPKQIQLIITEEARRLREESRRLRTEAESGWQAAKRWFEDQLLGDSQP